MSSDFDDIIDAARESMLLDISVQVILKYDDGRYVTKKLHDLKSSEKRIAYLYMFPEDGHVYADFLDRVEMDKLSPDVKKYIIEIKEFYASSWKLVQNKENINE